MTDFVRMIAIGGTLGVLVAGTLASPSLIGALAEESIQVVAEAVDEFFGPEAIDPRQFRKYQITFDDSVSTEVQRVRTISKIEMGRRSTVSIVSTPTGTYSSDAILSPHVRYPGIEVERKPERHRHRDGVSFYSMNGTYGNWTSTTVRSGSFIYYRASRS